MKENTLVRDLPHPAEKCSGKVQLLGDMYTHTIFAHVSSLEATVRGQIVLRKVKLEQSPKKESKKRPMKMIKFRDENTKL